MESPERLLEVIREDQGGKVAGQGSVPGEGHRSPSVQLSPYNVRFRKFLLWR